ncbi:MAG: GatB/YqeY domain-containing protein [Candidatus Eisenbacteria sp.]|nr:GatB/YqeY domain-containing protein [Candidatus Eisenbacteria bacterium]
MSLMREMDDRLKTAMRAKDKSALKVLRMIRTRLKEHIRNSKLEGEIPDDEVSQIVASYVKQLRKSLPEFEKGGESARGAISEIKSEIAYLEPFMPQLLDEAQTRAIVEKAVEELGHPPAKMMGKVIGHVMKDHKTEVDALLVRRLVQETLGE